MDGLQWLTLGNLLARGWPAGELRQLLATLQATDFDYGRERKLWTACQADADAVRKELAAMNVQVADGERVLAAVVAKVRVTGDRRRQREFADRLAIAARASSEEYERLLEAECRKRETPSVAGRVG